MQFVERQRTWQEGGVEEVVSGGHHGDVVLLLAGLGRQALNEGDGCPAGAQHHHLGLLLRGCGCCLPAIAASSVKANFLQSAGQGEARLLAPVPVLHHSSPQTLAFIRRPAGHAESCITAVLGEHNSGHDRQCQNASSTVQVEGQQPPENPRPPQHVPQSLQSRCTIAGAGSAGPPRWWRGRRTGGSSWAGWPG